MANEENQTKVKRLKLLVGVNFTAEGAKEETRVEPGIIDSGVLPAKFEADLIESKNARYVK